MAEAPPLPQPNEKLLELVVGSGLPQLASSTVTAVADPRRLHEILNRLAAVEERFLKQEFLAPIVRGSLAQVRIEGVICELRIDPPEFEGWGVFRPTSANRAQLVRAAGLAERQRYLELLPAVTMILCRHAQNVWLAIPAHRADQRFRFEGFVPVSLVEEGQLFEIVACRFDGSRCWYDAADSRNDPGAAAYLRNALEQLVEPSRLERSGLTAEQRAAYALCYWPKLEAKREAERDLTEERLRAALAHAGAEFKEYAERGDVYRVTYEVLGRRHTTAVDRRDLSVRVAGICLSGEDHKFDLHSMVGVLREANDRGGILAVGLQQGGMSEEAYWRAHPHDR